MGGAGRYVGYEDWHPAALTLGCAYQAMKVRTFSELQPFWSRLPLPIMSGCDDLRQKTLKLITANLDDTVVAVPFLKWVVLWDAGLVPTIGTELVPQLL